MGILRIIFFAMPLALFSVPLPKLSDYKQNTFSQFGEDGIVQKIFELIGTTSKIAVEFGASDGFFCSNTANLWTKDPHWQGILIESDSKLFEQLKANTAPYSNCMILHRAVGTSSYNSIESILDQIGIRETVDLLSIDIDGDDYYVFQSIDRIRPRLIICEYNPSIPAHLDVYSEPGNFIGSSVAALQRIASSKGYSLIAITDTNCFFVLNSEFSKFSGFDTNREHIRIDRYISYIISDFSGNYKVIGSQEFIQPWGWTGRQTSYLIRGDVRHLSKTVQ